MVLAWENLLRFLWCWSSFCCCCYSSFVDVLHSHFLFDIVPQPSDYRQVFRPILYFQPSPSQSDFRHFHFSIFQLSPYRERFSFEWAFFTHRRFLPYAPFRHFWHIPNILGKPAFIKVSLGAGLLKVAALHTDPRNTDPVHLFVWFTVIHNLLYILRLSILHISMSMLQILLVVKTLIRPAAILFSSHQNIKQQPN